MFFEKAKVGLNEIWRYITGSLIILFTWQIIGGISVFALMVYIKSKGGALSTDIIGSASAVGIDKNITLSMFLFSFVLGVLAIYFVVRYLHKKPFESMVTSREKFSWKRAGFGFFVWSAFTLGISVFDYYQTPEDYTLTFNASTFIPLLIICIVLLPIQTSFEELFLRGYLMQGIGLATGSKILALLLPAITFGLLHSFNPEVDKHGFFIMMSFYIGMGVFLGIIAIMDKGLEIPLGIHFANNLMVALVFNYEESALKTDAIFTMKTYDPVEGLPVFIAMVIIFTLCCSFFFKWQSWKTFFKKI